MNFIKRAILSSKARMGKTVILFAVMVTVCVVVLAGFGIKSATERASDLARQKLGAEVTLQADMQKVREQMMSEMTPSEDGKPMRVQMTQVGVPLSYLDEFANSAYISDYAISLTSGANASNFIAVGAEESESTEETNTQVQPGMPNGEMGMPDMGGGKGGMTIGDISLNGVNNLTSSTQYAAGEIEMVDGRVITADDLNSNVVVIEQTLAEENELNVGDTLSIVNAQDEEQVIELEIVGIYETKAEFNEMAFRSTASSPYNQLYVPYTTVSELKGEDYAETVDKIVFYLNDPKDVEAFLAEGEKTEIDFTTYTLDASNQAYESMMGPIENVASFSQTTLVLVTVFGGVILALIIMLSIKDRINEIGILLSLGERKPKIVMQFLTEVIVVLALALGASSIVGNSVSNLISEQLLSNELEVAADEQSSMMPGMQGGMNSNNGTSSGKFPMMGGGLNQQSQVDTMDELVVQITSAEFLQMSTVAFFVCIISTMLPAIYVMRLHPKTILSQHN